MKEIFSEPVIFFIVLIVMGAIWLYQHDVYQQNEVRGYCTEADQFLSEDEMRRRIMVNYIRETVRRDIETTSANHEISFYISKYNLNNIEEIINMMQNSKLKQSFEENFGVVAAAYMSEYRDVVYRDPVKLQSPLQIYRLVNRYAEVDRRYLDNLPSDYSFIYQSGDRATIAPESLIRRIDSKTYSMAFFSLEVACCDADYIETELEDQKDKERYFTKEGEPLIYTEPRISIDDIDGKIINNFSIFDAYDKIILTNPEQVRNMYIYRNAASLRSIVGTTPILKTRAVTACGDLQPLERKISAKRIEQDIFKWVRKVHLKLTTSPQ